MNEKVKLTEDYVKNLLEKMPIEQRENYLIKCVVDAEENKVELIAEQHRLFDLAKEQEKELNELREFARIAVEKSVSILSTKYYTNVDDYNLGLNKDQELNKAEYDFVKKVVEKYGKKEN